MEEKPSYARQEGLQDAGSSLDMERAGREVQVRMRQVEDTVRARPLTSLAAAVIAGFVIGRVFRD